MGISIFLPTTHRSSLKFSSKNCDSACLSMGLTLKSQSLGLKMKELDHW